MENRGFEFVNWLHVLMYLLFSFGAAMLFLYADMELDFPHGLTLTGIFGAPAFIAWLFYKRYAGRGWLITAMLSGAASMFIFTVSLAAEEIIHPALLFALYAFTGAGMIMYFINRKRSADGRGLNSRIEFDKLGTREKTPAERDTPRAA